MGYRRPKAFHVLSLGGDLAGLTIRVRHRTGLHLQALGELMTSESPPSGESPWPLLPLFLDALHWWDLETEDGGMVPPTREALLGFDDEFIREVLRAYWYVLDMPYPVGQVSRDEPAMAGGEPVVSPRATDARTSPDVPEHPRTEPDAADTYDMDIPPITGPSLEELERFVVDTAGPPVAVPA